MIQYARKISSETRAAQTKSQGKRQILGLDLLRFSAAILVLGFHLAWLNRMEHRGWAMNYQFAYLDRFTHSGWVGVDVFFALSGFVIAYSAESATPLKFVESRLLRLYPAVWICSTVTFIALIASAGFHPYQVRIWIEALVLMPTAMYIDSSYWTLGIEMSFYALIFALLALRSFRFLGVVLTILAAISTGCLAYAGLAQIGAIKVGAAGIAFLRFFGTRYAQLLLLQHGPLFALGTLLWLALFHRITLFRAAAICFCFLGSVLAVRNDWLTMMHTAQAVAPFTGALAMWVLGIVGIVLAVKKNEVLADMAGARGAKAIRMLGLITYPLYLIHQRIGYIVMERLHGYLPDIALLVMTSALAVGFAYLSVRFAERPLQTRLREAFRALRGKTPEPASSLP